MARLNDCPLCAAEADETGEIVLRLVAGKPLRLGAWCPTCSLPSVAVLSVRFACRHGWPSGSAGMVAWCADHEGIVSVPTD